MDGQFTINSRGSVVATPDPPTMVPSGLEAKPPPTVCTPDDPFGRGNSSPQFEPSSPWSRTEQEMNAARDKSAGDLGMAIHGPLLKALEWSPPGRTMKLLKEGADILSTLSEGGPTSLANEQLRALAIKVISDSIARKLKLPEGSGDLIGNGIQDAIKLGGGGGPPQGATKSKGPDDGALRDGPRFVRPDRETEKKIQQGVDRQEHRDLTDPGTMIA